MIISKETFVECIEAIKKQQSKDYKFADFMENYLDGRCVPIMNEDVTGALIKLLGKVTENRNDEFDSWVDWWIYECEFGKKKMEAYVDDKTYIMNTAEELYEFIKMYNEWKKEKEK